MRVPCFRHKVRSSKLRVKLAKELIFNKIMGDIEKCFKSVSKLPIKFYFSVISVSEQKLAFVIIPVMFCFSDFVIANENYYYQYNN